MRATLVLLAAVAALAALSETAGAAERSAVRLPRSALLPNAVAFRNRSQGVLGTGRESCINGGFHCHLEGTISITTDGGESWKVVKRTPRPVVSIVRASGAYYARYDDGETLRSRDGRAWRATAHLPAGPAFSSVSVCPAGAYVGINSGAGDWSLCMTEPSAGNQGKAVYRDHSGRWVLVACTGFFDMAPCSPGHGYGGISSYGYPIGIAGSTKSFAIIWETRGTLYVTRDGGHHWHALPTVARPEIDFASWAFVLPRGGVGFALLHHGGGNPSRLVETTNGGRTWHVVHRWR